MFVLSSVRSGSTLLRVMLGSHSQLYAPHELHLNDVRVNLSSWFSESSMADLGFDKQELTNLLWDRTLDIALKRSGKRTIVEKTPNHLLVYQRIAENWRDARFIFLLRHPASIYQSWHSARPNMSQDEAVESTLKYVTKLEEARHELTGIDVRYEDLTTDPEAQTRRICEYLKIPWEPGMVDYGESGQTTFKRGLGDWSGKIRSGKPQAGRPLPKPDEVPEGLRGICRTWGYLAAEEARS
ncbi:MAG: sulfotransferase [Actinocatenispora sp.]